MAETKGIVREVKGNKVIVSTSKGGCHSCPLSKICSVNDINEVEAIAQEELKVGDRVNLYNSDLKLIVFDFVLFILPLIVLIISYAILPQTLSQGIRIIIALLVMSVYYILLGTVEKKFKDRFILPRAEKSE